MVHRCRFTPNANVAVTVATTSVRLASTLRTGVAVAPRPGCSARPVPTTAGVPRPDRATRSAIRDFRRRVRRPRPAVPGRAVVFTTRQSAGSAASIVPAKITAIAASAQREVEREAGDEVRRRAPRRSGVSGENT